MNTVTDMDCRTRILVADDHAVIREGLAAILARQPEMCVVAEATNGEEAVSLFQQHLPDLVLMDVMMPGIDGIEATRAICAQYPQARILLLTHSELEEDIYQGLSAGARGYVLKDAGRAELVQAIETIATGQRVIPPEVASKLADRVAMIPLTGREMDVLRLMAEGNSNDEIARSLLIAEGTVKIHIGNIMHKLRVHDRTQVVVTALRRGLVHF